MSKKTYTAADLCAAYYEGFSNGEDRGHHPRKEPPLSVAWIASEAYKKLRGEMTADEAALVAAFRSADNPLWFDTEYWQLEVDKLNEGDQ